MAEAFHRELPRTDKATDQRLRFGVFAAPIAWVLHEVIGVAVVGRACYGNAQLTAWQWITLGAVSIVAALVAVAGGLSAYRVFRQWENGARITRAEGWDRVEFVSLMGMFLSGFLLLNIIYFGVMPLVVDPCVRTI